MLAACVIWPARHRLRLRELKRPAVLEAILLFAVFLGMYLALPLGTVDAGYIDVRALALVSLFAVIAFLCLWDEDSMTRSLGSALALPLAALLATGNLAYLGKHLHKDDAWLSSIRAVVAAVPQGTYVLFGHTLPYGEKVKPFLHSDSYVVADRGGITPNLFSGDAGNPMKYFRYIHRPYMVEDEWYVAWPAPLIDWQEVACRYDFLLLTKPFEPRRIGLATTTVAENESAALLAPVKGSCTANAVPAAASIPRN
jgi:hypothetical protein